MFFNSGATCGDLDDLAAAVRDPETLIAIDGYHGFMARADRPLRGRAAGSSISPGGYKYAMAGEGACFLHCPPGYAPRPRDTGWFAAFGASRREAGGRGLRRRTASRFLGATFDPSGLYRQRAVFAWMESLGLTVEAIHAHVLALQEHFLRGRCASAASRPLRGAAS